MANRACLARLRKEVKSFEPPPYIRAAPLETNMQEWRFVLQGPPDSPYEGGLYQGKVKFPDDYPFKPPKVRGRSGPTLHSITQDNTIF